MIGMMHLAPAFAAGALLTGAPLALAVPPVSSDFERGPEQWSVTDLNCSSFNVVDTYDVEWFPSGGDPGGHIGRFDPTANCYHFNAPPAYLGDQSSRVGGQLRFSLRTNANDWTPGSIIILVGDGVKLVHDTPQPNDTWQQYLVPLHAAAFGINSAGGPAPTDEQFAAALASLEAVRISAEYGGEVEETTWLDSVCLQSAGCVADLNCDADVNVNDLLALLSAWGECDHCVADVDADGSVGTADLLELLSAWGPCS